MSPDSSLTRLADLDPAPISSSLSSLGNIPTSLSSDPARAVLSISSTNSDSSLDSDLSLPSDSRLIETLPSLSEYNSKLDTCPKCSETFFPKGLVQHIVDDHAIKDGTVFFCPLNNPGNENVTCSKTTNFVSVLRRHISDVHFGQRRFTCATCGIKRHKKSAIENHKCKLKNLSSNSTSSSSSSSSGSIADTGDTPATSSLIHVRPSDESAERSINFIKPTESSSTNSNNGKRKREKNLDSDGNDLGSSSSTNVKNKEQNCILVDCPVCDLKMANKSLALHIANNHAIKSENAVQCPLDSEISSAEKCMTIFSGKKAVYSLARHINSIHFGKIRDRCNKCGSICCSKSYLENKHKCKTKKLRAAMAAKSSSSATSTSSPSALFSSTASTSSSSSGSTLAEIGLAGSFVRASAEADSAHTNNLESEAVPVTPSASSSTPNIYICTEEECDKSFKLGTEFLTHLIDNHEFTIKEAEEKLAKISEEDLEAAEILAKILS